MKLSKTIVSLLFPVYITAQALPGKPVYLKKTNTLWIVSFSRNTQADNKLYAIDLNKSFNTLHAPVIDFSTQISGNQCPVMHFAQALPDADGVSINIFGAGSVNNVYSSTMTICQYNTVSKSWGQLNPPNAPVARRNAALEVSRSNLTYIYGGNSDTSTGLDSTMPNFPNYWHQDLKIYDSNNEMWLTTDISYNGYTRSNATITQIGDTNGQLVILGGALINNTSSFDAVTNFPLANMSDIVVVDPRSSSWTNMTSTGTLIPGSRKHHTTTLHPDGHTLVVIGGEFFNDSGAYLLNDVWTLDTSDRNNYVWSQPVLNGTGLYRSNHTSLLIGDQLWVIAGTNASAKAVDIQLLNVTSWTWSYDFVSTYVPPSNALSAVGGIGGLIGIIVGVLAVVAISGCCVFWFCCRNRIKPSKNMNSDPQDFSYHDEGEFSHKYHNETDRYPDISTTTGSKITSRPSLSTASNPNIGEWHNQQSPLPLAYVKAGSLDGYRYYEDNCFADNSAYNQSGDPSSLPIHHDTQRVSIGLWDGKTRQLPTHQSYSSFDPNNYLLTPMGNDAQRPVSKFSSAQKLQKPNELDEAALVTSKMSQETNTVHSGDINEDESASTTLKNL